MYVSIQTIITAAGVVTAFAVLLGYLGKVYKWYSKQNKQDVEIQSIKEEQQLLTYGILACLKGLKEQGCNGPVTAAIDKIEKHLNKKAHE